MDKIIFTPADFVAVFNQTLELAYPSVIIEGELANFRLSRGRWVYFDVKDEPASVKFFGSVFKLPGPLQDGLRVQVIGQPRLHPQFGFSITFSAVQPVGEGSIKKAADLLHAKLETEGLFAPQRKRLLPEFPLRIGLITAAASAACADFIKILGERWGGVEVLLADVPVQGQEAPAAIVSALNHLEQISPLVDVLVVTRGGGSAEDLAAFNDERVVRAIAGSRTPTLVAIGHEIDISLAELAADMRASTPTNAAQLVVPDRTHVVSQLQSTQASLYKFLLGYIALGLRDVAEQRKYLTGQVFSLLDQLRQNAQAARKLIGVFDPAAALRRGYAIVKKGRAYVTGVGQVSAGDRLAIQLSDGKINAHVVGS
jgi:exodeoxyribonuclease VII large subunit